jgi:large subunit ribosomal protein L19
MASAAQILDSVRNELTKSAQPRPALPDFRPGDTVRVHARIVEGNKERIQVFEGMCIKRHKGSLPSASFTVRKISYDVGVERTFLVHSPRVEKVEVITRGVARRARLFHLRPLRGRAAKVKTKVEDRTLVTAEAAPAAQE